MRVIGAVVVFALAGCAEEAEPGDDSEGVAEWDVPRDCPPPDGITEAPRSIEEVVALVNALPKPTTLSCYLQALPRPIALYATTSTFSAQPAGGPSDPRIFVFADALSQSVVPSGPGAVLLELGVFTSPTRSIKAEIEFPVEAALLPADPYEQVRVGSGTNCGVCHLDEYASPDVTVTTAYASQALQPPPEDGVSLSLVRQYARDCDADATPERCSILTGLFAHGDTTTAEFPAEATVCRGF